MKNLSTTVFIHKIVIWKKISKLRFETFKKYPLQLKTMSLYKQYITYPSYHLFSKNHIIFLELFLQRFDQFMVIDMF